MKKECFFCVIIFLSVMACDKDEVNPVQNLENEMWTIEIVHGDNQTGVYNSPLEDSMVVRVIDQKGKPVPNAAISFEYLKGQGDISPDWLFTDSLGRAWFNMVLRCNSDYNELGVYVNDRDFNKTDSVIFHIEASLPDGWGRSCGIEYAGSFETFFFEHNGVIHLVNYNQIYTTSDEGVSWQEYASLPEISRHSDIFDVQFNNQGWMYIATEDDGIFYSKDQMTWNKISSGISDIRNPMTFLVEDDCLFVSFYFGGLYRSLDNGQTWEEVLVDESSHDRYVFIRRHPNGDLYLFDHWDDFWRSSDNGDTWERISLEYKYTNYQVEDFEIDQQGTLYIGAGDATMSILSSDTYQGISYSYYEWNASTQHVEDIKIYDGIVYYTANGNPDAGIYSSQNWSKIDLGFESRIYDYHLKADGSFLIASSAGVYYYSE